jgi:hypothetical protein
MANKYLWPLMLDASFNQTYICFSKYDVWAQGIHPSWNVNWPQHTELKEIIGITFLEVKMRTCCSAVNAAAAISWIKINTLEIIVNRVNIANLTQNVYYIVYENTWCKSLYIRQGNLGSWLCCQIRSLNFYLIAVYYNVMSHPQAHN